MTYRQQLAALRKQGITVVSASQANTYTWLVEFEGIGARRHVQVGIDRSPTEYSPRERETEARQRAVAIVAHEQGLT